MTKSQLPPLSHAETEILTILWTLGQATIQQLVDKLPKDRTIAYATVQTLIRRLEAKGYITHTQSGKAHVFAPLAKKEDVLNRSVKDFLKRLFAGDPTGLVLHLARHGDLTKQDIDRLSKLLTSKKSER